MVGGSFLYSDQTLLTHPVLLTHRLPESFSNRRVKLQANKPNMGGSIVRDNVRDKLFRGSYKKKRKIFSFFLDLSHFSWAADSNLGTAIRSAVGIVIDKSLTTKIICILSTYVFSKEWYRFSYHVDGSFRAKN